MPPTNDSPEIVLRADRICAALVETLPTPRRLGIANIAQCVGDPKGSLSVEEQGALFSNSQLWANCRRLKIQNRFADSDSNATGLFLFLL